MMMMFTVKRRDPDMSTILVKQPVHVRLAIPLRWASGIVQQQMS